MSKNKFFKKLLVAGLCALTATAAIGTTVAFTGCKKEDENKTQTVKYSVTFKLDYEGAADIKKEVEEGSKVAKPEDPKREGYKFEGWILASDGTPYNFDSEVSSDITLKAKWTKVSTEPGGEEEPGATECAFTWDLDGGAWPAGYTAVTKHEKNKTFKIPAEKPTKKGYEFIGWQIAEGSPSVNSGYELNVTADVTFKALWKAVVTYTVSYNMNGHGSPLPPTEDITEFDNNLETPTAEGWTFGGWYLDAACTQKATGKLTADTTVYAKWTEVINFDTISKRENKIESVTSDFSTEAEGTKFPLFSGTYGKQGFYSLPQNDGSYETNYVKVTGGAAQHVASGNNVAMIVDFGPVKNVVEGYLELKCSDMGSKWEFVQFYSGTSKVFTIKTDGNKDLAYSLKGTDGVSQTALTPKVNVVYKIHYKFDLNTGKVTADIDGKPIVTDLETDINELSGIQLIASNSGKRLLTIDNVAVSADKMTVAEYQAYAIGKLEKKAENDAYTGDNLKNLQAERDKAKTAVEAATDIDGVWKAYADGVKAMDAVKNDLTVKQETAIAELENYKQEVDYDTDNWAKVLAEVVKGKNTINAAETVEAVDKALADAKAEIDKIPDKNAAVWTITFNDGTSDCGTISIVQGQTATLDDLKAKVNVPNGQKLVGIYTDSALTQEITESFTPTADSTLYVKLEVLAIVTYNLNVDTIPTTAPADGEVAINDIFSINAKAKREVNKIADSGYTNQLSLTGGKVSTTANGLKMVLEGEATITIVAGEKSDKSVTLMLINAEGKTVNPTNLTINGTAASAFDTLPKTSVNTYVFTLSAGTYYVGGSGGGAYLYAVSAEVQM